MKVKLRRQNQAYHFEGNTESGLKVNLDSSSELGGEGKGARPMELVLMAVGACTSIDIGQILKKQRQELKDYSVSIEGERYEDSGKAFKAIHLHYELWGELDEQKVNKAIELAVTKYCSVILSLDKSIVIDYTFKIHN